MSQEDGESPQLLTLTAGALDLAVWDWPGDDPPLLFAHATGFHGRCWDQVASRFPGRRRLAVDFRGHGRSSKPAPPYPWQPFAGDLAAIADALYLHGCLGVGHSMGGHSVVAAALLHPNLFSALLLIDPTIFSPERYDDRPFDANFIRRRRAVFASPEEMWERFHRRPPFVDWHPAVLRDYCRFGLLPSDGRFVLACPPDVEASIYEHSKEPASNLHSAIPSLQLPVVIIRAGVSYRPDVFDLYASPTAPDLAARFPHGRDVLLPDRDHFIPMQSPELVADWIGRLLARQAQVLSKEY